MKTIQLPRRLKSFRNKIEELEKTDTYFKRLCREYDNMNAALWEFENSKDIYVTDEFIDSLQVQAYLLEEEIQELLKVHKTI